MTLLRHRFGGAIFAKVAASGDLREALDDHWMESETVIVKPNWVAVEPGGFTDAEIKPNISSARAHRRAVSRIDISPLFLAASLECAVGPLNVKK